MANWDDPNLKWDMPGLFYDERAALPVIRMKPKKIKTGFSALALDDKLQLTQNVITGLSDNAAVFTTPNPPVANITTLRSNIVAKTNEIEAAQDGLASLFQERAVLIEQLDTALSQEAAYVQNVTAGDAAKIALSGFEVRSAPSPVGPLPAPKDLHSNYGSAEGSVECQWDRVRGAQAYFVECGQDSDGPWNQVYAGTATHCAAAGLTPGSQYWFRVRALGTAGLGPWSDPSSKRAA
jgi:hypothetical protein